MLRAMTTDDGYRWNEASGGRRFEAGQVLRLVGVLLLAGAILQQLRRPSDQRDWHGKVLGVVPYDFRPPSLGRFASRWFNPGDHRLFTEHAFGIGWSVNIAQAIKMATGMIARK
jgi:hypothetical protein